jgi:RNA polymerase sigma factor (sigma-70 family)
MKVAVLTAEMTLLDAAKRGDDGAFEILLKPLLEPGYRLAGGMLQDHQAAQDAVQEAAFKAWRKLRQLRDGSEMRPWFLGIVANECRSVRRSRWSSVLKLLVPAGAEAPPVESVLSGIELRQALGALDEKKRLALVLRWYLDLPLEEIATITGSSVHAVEGQLQRGIHELRRRMEDHRD